MVADIPGLIEGAHRGKGLGVQFLRHIERTKVLVFLIDGTAADIRADYQVLLNELKLFNKDLTEKPQIILVTKIDIIDEDKLKTIKRLRLANAPSHFISAVARKGITKLVGEMWKSIGRAVTMKPDPPAHHRRAASVANPSAKE